MNVPQKEEFHWNFNFTILLMVNLLNLNNPYHWIFADVLMIAIIMEIQVHVLKFTNISFFEFSPS